jgi:hypothetical protein
MLLPNIAFASELVIKGMAPDGFKVLDTSLMKLSGAPSNAEGDHGLSEYCYENASYVILSSNVVGKGYKFSSKKPENLNCLKITTKIHAKNKLGIHIGMTSKEIELLLKIKSIETNRKIIWKDETYHNGIWFDYITSAEFKFHNGRLVWLSVFTTETG